MSVDLIIIILFALFGISLLVMEIFLIPGFGVAGIGGILFMSVSIIYAFNQLGPEVGLIVLAVSLFIIIFSIYWFIRSKTLDKMALKTDINSKAPSMLNHSVHIGDLGKTLSRLNPMGKIVIKGEEIEAKTVEGFLDENIEVEVIRINSNNVTVRPIPDYSKKS